MGLGKFFGDRFKTKLIPLTILDIIHMHKICSPMNKLEFKMNSAREDEPRAWLNPNDQDSFNSGWFRLDERYG